MSAKYFVFAGGRWCEVDARTGRVSGWRARARFCFVRGQRLHAARSAAVLRALRALAAGAPAAVRDAAPLPRCPRPRRPYRSRSRRRSACRLSHAHCCSHSHGRCDVNANELVTKPPAPTAVASPRKQRASSSDQEIRFVESVQKSPVKQSQASPEKSPRILNRPNRQSPRDKMEKPARKPVTLSSDETEEPVARGKASPMKSPQKLSSRKIQSLSDDMEKPVRKPVTRGRQFSGSDVAEKPVARGKASPVKSPQKLSRRKRQSSSDEMENPARKPVTRARQSSQQHVNVIVIDKNSKWSSSSDESEKPVARGKTSPIKSPQKLSRRKRQSSSDEEEKPGRAPVTRARLSSQRVKVVEIDSTPTIDTSDEEPQQSKTVGKTSKQPAKLQKQTKHRWGFEISSDEDSEKRVERRTRPQRQAARHADVDIVADNSDAKRVKTTKSVASKDSDSSSEETKTKSQTRRYVSRAEKLLKRLLETSDDEVTDEESERAGTGTERSVRCKELVIGESDVETLRRFVKERGGRENLMRFDRDERYKLRIFHRLNPLVTLQRHQSLESLLRQRLTLTEFARNLGLRSVAEVTPEKRYRMRRSTKNARVASDTEDKENVAKPKRRRLWNNENAMLNNRESISSEVLKTKPQIIKPAFNRDSSGDSSDRDAEFKRKVREHLAKKQRINSSEVAVKAQVRSSVAATPLKENVKPNNSSSTKVAEMLERSDDEPRQTRSNKNITPTVKPQNVAAVSKFAKVNTDKDDKEEIRRTRSSIKAGESPMKSKHSESDNVVKRKVTIISGGESSEREVVRNTRSSNVEIPARTLKEQNKKLSSDSDSVFEPSRSSPKKANMIRKGKVHSRITNLPNKDGNGKSKASNKVIARAKENEKTSAFLKSMTVKPVKFKKSSVANGREYTSLEDHAIVAWVCGGNQRERLVNGNRLWRELALDYRRITGQDRSWHSLRNRYLRYVLPALGALALPPAQVSRLRAAAAAGEIKSRGAKQRRNSIFTAPAVRSASGKLRDRAATKRGEEQSDKEQRSKTDAKEQEEVREQSKPQTGGTRDRGKGGRWIKDKPTPKKDPPSPAAPRVTRSSVGSPSRGHRHK